LVSNLVGGAIRRGLPVAFVCVAASALSLWSASAASAAPQGPGWFVEAAAQPTVFEKSTPCIESAGLTSSTNECDHYTVIVANAGAKPSSGPVTVSISVPASLAIESAKLEALYTETEEFLTCGVAGQVVECIYEGEVQPEGFLQIRVPVVVEAATSPGALLPAEVEVSGGEAGSQTASMPTAVEVPVTFGVERLPFLPHAADGGLDAQAGSHPYGLIAGFELASHFRAFDSPVGCGACGGPAPIEDPKSALVYLPLGMVGDPSVLPQCSLATLRYSISVATSCPAASRLGNVVLYLHGEVGSRFSSFSQVSPVFNVTPEAGYPAEFGFAFHHKVVLLYASVVHDGSVPGDYALRVGTPGIPTVEGLALRVDGVSLSFFGNPAERNGGSTSSAAFLTNPTRCGGPLNVRLEANSWQNPSRWVTAEHTVFPAVTGCDRLQFHPSIRFKPETIAADTPSGYEVEVKIPQAPNVAPSLATPDLKDAKVMLPEGLVLSPSAANGLSGCAATGPEGINLGSGQIGPAGQDLGNSEATEFGAGHPGGNGSPYDDGIYHAAPGHCPGASQIGELEIETPVLTEPLQGHVYVARPTCGGLGQSPCTDADAVNGSLYGIYLEAKGSGAIVKLHGKVAADPQTGQLTATFTENPQLPFESFRLRFDGGRLAPLANPQTCGSYPITSDFIPWSTPSTPEATPQDFFEIGSGPNGSACAHSEDEEPNKPSFEAGTVIPLAGAYSPLVLRLSREDGSQRLARLNDTNPEGLLGRLAGIPYCPDAAIAAARGKSGTGEKANPTCPPASEVGAVTVGAGPGPSPFYVHGHAYLAGPYKGAPLSLAIVTPAVAGPFDLGAVVVRVALYVNPETAQIHAVSDPIPTILAGTPLDVRSIALDLDRPDFTLNPTSCEEMAVTGDAISPTGRAAPLTNRFQVGGCRGLDFAPKLALRVFGKTNRNAKPRFRAVLQTTPGEANIARAQVNLPHSEFLEQGHIKTICTRVQFNAGAGNGAECPTNSIYGHARAFTPLLDKPLEGPVYLRSSSQKLPDLVAALNGQVDVVLNGKVDTGPNKGIRNTFEMVPDAPVSKFILEMKGGKKGLLVNSEDLCSKRGKSSRAIVRFTAQNGKVESFKSKVRNQCSSNRRKAGHAGRRG
jgi:hypothetical protein